jgi:mannan endo-1,4-beta-mannosidase
MLKPDVSPTQAALFPLLLAGALLFAAGCAGTRGATGEAGRSEKMQPIDGGATAQTRALYARLHRLDDRIMFGHQDDLAYGVNWVNEPGRSDVKETAGAYPALYGWELGDLGREGATENLDGVSFENIKGWIKDVYRRGGVSTISWHMMNPATGGSSWDTTRTVPEMLPGGDHHDEYKRLLDDFAAFAGDLETDGGFLGIGGGEPIPVIFRPFHEMTGGWFWWGRGNVTPKNYKKLWRFTVDYLRDEKGVHHLLYAYSPDAQERMSSPEAYYRHYPGDEYVDILAFDNYVDLQEEGASDSLATYIRWLVDEAEARGKVPAFSETGYEGIPDSTWWTGKLLPALDADEQTRQLAYVLTWRNANKNQKDGHFFAPYPGHPSAPDFRAFKQDPLILFEDGLPPMCESR